MDNNPLKTWMQVNEKTNASLAVEMDYSYEYIYKLANGQSTVSEGFKWRFATVFGYELAQELFGDAEAEHATA